MVRDIVKAVFAPFKKVQVHAAFLSDRHNRPVLCPLPERQQLFYIIAVDVQHGQGKGCICNLAVHFVWNVYIQLFVFIVDVPVPEIRHCKGHNRKANKGNSQQY